MRESSDALLSTNRGQRSIRYQDRDSSDYSSYSGIRIRSGSPGRRFGIWKIVVPYRLSRDYVLRRVMLIQQIFGGNGEIVYRNRQLHGRRETSQSMIVSGLSRIHLPPVADHAVGVLLRCKFSTSIQSYSTESSKDNNHHTNSDETSTWAASAGSTTTDEPDAMSRRLAEMTEQSVQDAGARGTQLLQEAGISEELKRTLEESITTSPLKPQYADAMTESSIPVRLSQISTSGGDSSL